MCTKLSTSSCILGDHQPAETIKTHAIANCSLTSQPGTRITPDGTGELTEDSPENEERWEEK
jgi:hypothetical protein